MVFKDNNFVGEKVDIVSQKTPRVPLGRPKCIARPKIVL